MSITKETVAEDRRTDHTADLFGEHFPLAIEPTIFSMASRLSKDYQGGYWNFYALSNGGFFMSPEDDCIFTVSSENGYQGSMSAEAFGMTVCLYAFSHLSFSDNGELATLCCRQFHLLREYMLDHQEVGAILGAID